MFKIGTGPAPSLKQPEKFSNDFSEFIKLCLNKDPTGRPTTQDLLRNTWITGAKSTSAVLTEVILDYKVSIFFFCC